MLENFKKVLFTHDDLDGAGCRILFESACKEKGYEYEIINSHNTTIDQDVQNYISEHPYPQEYFFADICCSEQLLKSIAADLPPFDGKHIVHVCDHHKTNQFAKEIKNVDALVISDANDAGEFQCGTSLLPLLIASGLAGWDIKYGNMFIKAIQYWDTFMWKNDPELRESIHARQLNTLFHIMRMDLFCEYFLEKIDKLVYELQNTAYIGEIIPDIYFRKLVKQQIKDEDEAIEKFAKSEAPKFQFSITESDGQIRIITAAYFVAPGQLNISTAMSKYLEYNPDVDVACMYMNQYGTLSFRTTRDDISVAEICKACDGGGHPKAAGCPAPSDLTNNITGIIKNYIEAHTVS